MKPGKFDDMGSLESFLVQFDVCAQYNQWSENDEVDYLRYASDKAETQSPDVSFWVQLPKSLLWILH